MAQEQVSTADLFRWAQALRRENSQLSYKEIKERLTREFKGHAFPSLQNVTIPEQDSRAPEEDWSAGLSVVRGGMQCLDGGGVL